MSDHLFKMILIKDMSSYDTKLKIPNFLSLYFYEQQTRYDKNGYSSNVGCFHLLGVPLLVNTFFSATPTLMKNAKTSAL